MHTVLPFSMERASPPADDVRTAGDLLRPHFLALAPELPLGEADALLEMTRARCLPVVDSGRLAGVLTHRALHERYAEALRALGDGPASLRRERLEALRARPVREVMAPPSATATPETPLPQLARLLERVGTGCVAVLDSLREGASIQGIVTESDMLRAARDERFRRVPAVAPPGA